MDIPIPRTNRPPRLPPPGVKSRPKKPRADSVEHSPKLPPLGNPFADPPPIPKSREPMFSIPTPATHLPKLPPPGRAANLRRKSEDAELLRVLMDSLDRVYVRMTYLGGMTQSEAEYRDRVLEEVFDWWARGLQRLRGALWEDA